MLAVHQVTVITAVSPQPPGQPAMYVTIPPTLFGLLQLISAISMLKNGDELDLEGGGLGNLKLVYFPSMISPSCP